MKDSAKKRLRLRLFAANATAIRLVVFFAAFFFLLLLVIVLSHDAIHAERKTYKQALLQQLTHCSNASFSTHAPNINTKTQNVTLVAVHHVTSEQSAACGTVSEWRTKNGYSGAIDFMLTFVDGALTHMKVVQHKETPSIGDRITQSQWQQQFLGGDAALPFDAISGATISSQAMIDAVSDAYTAWREYAKSTPQTKQ